jgi:diguanylate cyclase (GGDEF)-like protein
MILAGILDILSAQTVNAILHRDTSVASPTTLPVDDLGAATPCWKKVLPAVLVLVFGLLTFLLWLRGEQIFRGRTLMVGGFIVLILMALRQCLTMYQISLLQNRLRKENCALDRLNAQLEKQIMTDPLTDVSTHQALTRKLAEIIANARALEGKFSVIFMDIDRFKEINDTYGHMIGDQVLRRFARIVTATVRGGGLVGRWGGEEFAVILPGIGVREAQQVAERIRLAVSQQGREGKDEPGITCSLGLACYPEDAREPEALLRLADEAMYTAKYLGRNRVCCAHQSLTLTRGETVEKIEQQEKM